MSEHDDFSVPEVPDGEDSSVIRELRQMLKDSQKQLRKVSKENEGLRDSVAEAAFAQVGLEEKHRELFLKVNPDAIPTADAVKEFADEYGLAAQAPQPAPSTEETPAEAPAADAPEQPASDEQVAPEDQTAGFQPSAGGAVPPEPVTTKDLLAAVARGDMEFVKQVAAEEATKGGRIKYSHGDALGE